MNRCGPVLALVAICSLLAACSGARFGLVGPASGPIAATVKEWQISLSSTTLSAGAITFNITNDGDKEHEFVVRKTDLNSDELPLNADGEVSEDATELTEVGDPSEVAEIAPGSTDRTPDRDAPAGALRHLLQPARRGSAALPEGHARRLHGQLTPMLRRIAAAFVDRRLDAEDPIARRELLGVTS